MISQEKVKIKIYQPFASKIGREEPGALEFTVDLSDDEMTIEEVISLNEEYGENLLSLFDEGELVKNITIVVNGQIDYEGLNRKVNGGDEIIFLPIYGGG